MDEVHGPNDLHAEKNRANNLESTSSGVLLVHLVTLAVFLPNDKRTIRGWKLGGYKGNPKYLTRREPGETNQPQRPSLSAQRYQRQKFHSCSCWAEDQKTYTISQAKHFAVCTIWKDWSSRLRRMNKPFAKWMWVIPSSWHLGGSKIDQQQCGVANSWKDLHICCFLVLVFGVPINFFYYSNIIVKNSSITCCRKN